MTKFTGMKKFDLEERLIEFSVLIFIFNLTHFLENYP